MTRLDHLRPASPWMTPVQSTRLGRLLRLPAACVLIATAVFCTAVTTEASKGASPTLCDATYQPMYCRCDVEEGDAEEATDVQCFVTAPMTADDAFFKVFEGAPSVESVSFTTYASSTHRINFVPTNALRQMPRLEKVKFSQMSLGALSKRAFYNMSRLTVLSIDSNEITALEKESISNLPRLRKLELADNNLTRLADGVLTELPSLTHLFLERNQISSIEDMVFAHLGSVREIELSDNLIENLTESTFKGLRQLNRLDLFRNKIQRLEARVFAGAPELVEVDLKYNAIVEVDPLAFDGLPRLAILYLSYNRLRVLPANMFLGAPNLLTVDLSQNQLVTLTWRTLQDLGKIDGPSFDLSLTGNRFGCDCRLAWMLYLENNTRSDKFRRELRHVKCEFDAGTTSKSGASSSKVIRLSLKQLGCKEDYEHPRIHNAVSSSPPSVLSPANAEPTKLWNRGNSSFTAHSEDIVESSAMPPVFRPGPGPDSAKHDHERDDDQTLANDVDAVLSQQKALSKEPPRQQQHRPNGMTAGGGVPSTSTSRVTHILATVIALGLLKTR